MLRSGVNVVGPSVSRDNCRGVVEAHAERDVERPGPLVLGEEPKVVIDVDVYRCRAVATCMPVVGAPPTGC